MDVPSVLRILDRRYPTMEMQRVGTTPFRTLLATLISQRARDTQTLPVAEALFRVADTPHSVLRLSDTRLSRLLKPAGKYRQNMKRIREVSRILLQRYGGRVPDREKDLLALPGVGRKTANTDRRSARHGLLFAQRVRSLIPAGG